MNSKLQQSYSVLQTACNANYKDILFNVLCTLTDDGCKSQKEVDILSMIIANAFCKQTENEEFKKIIETLLELELNNTLLHVVNRLSKDLCEQESIDVLMKKMNTKDLSCHGKWHYAKLTFDDKPPLNKVRHQFLTKDELDLYQAISYEEKSGQKKRTFGPLVGISNAHIDYMMPSIYEKILKEDICKNGELEIEVYADIQDCANANILLKLEKCGIIILKPFKLGISFARIKDKVRSCDHIALTDSCLYLNKNNINNIYSDKTIANTALTERIIKRVRRIIVDDSYQDRLQKKMVCMHNRDKGYKSQTHMMWRDSDPNILAKCVREILPKEYKLIRIGKNGGEIDIKHKVNYDKNADINQMSDEFLLARSEIFIGTTSGPGHYAQLFSDLVLLTNATSLLPSNCPVDNTIIGLRKIIDLKGSVPDDRILSLMGDWGDVNLIKHRELNMKEMEKEISDFINKRVCTISNIMPIHTIKEYPILNAIMVTERCYDDIKLAICGENLSSEYLINTIYPRRVLF